MNITIGTKINAAGVSIERTEQRTIEGADARQVTLAVGKAGHLTTRDDASEGTLTMASGHGITTGAKIDLYWDGGVQRRITVGTVSGNSVPFAGGLGDNLPADESAIVACVRQVVNLQIDAQALSLLAVEASVADKAAADQVCVCFRETDTTEVTALLLEPNVPQVFDAVGTASNDDQVSNPLAADVASFTASNGSATNVATLRVIVASDPTP